MNERVTYRTICQAKSGDPEAMEGILHHYARYIAHFSKRPFFDEYGNRYEVIDDEIRQRIEVKLMLQIVYKYDPWKLPFGEKLT